MVYKRSVFLFLFTFLLYAGSLFAQFQPSCLFISKGGNDVRDSLLIDHLKDRFDIRVISDDAFYDSTLTLDSLKQFDFGFVSESMRTWTMEFGIPKLKTAPIPLFITEGYMTKSNLLGWNTGAADTSYGTIVDTLGATGQNALILDDTEHPLTAGFGNGSEVQVVSDKDGNGRSLTFTVPEVDYIPIAVSSLNPDLTIVAGVEAGTTVWNDDGTELTVSDSTVTQNRVALVGIHANTNEFITEDGYKLIDAGINWVLPKRCLFISKGGNDARDTLLIDHLKKTYDVTEISDAAFYDSTLTVEDLKQFDFGFVSESMRTWTMEFGIPKLKTVPIPLFITEGYMTKSNILGWNTGAADTSYGTITDTLAATGQNALILDDTEHPLAAGFGNGSEVQVVSDKDGNGRSLTFTVPEVEYISIAVSSLNPDLTIVAGVEAGTTVWNDDGTEFTVSDSTVTQNRVALVGIHANTNEFITEDGYKLIDAGIKWVLKETSGIVAIEKIISNQPKEFTLNQNYPNPFNPSTTIEFSLNQSGHTTLTIYNTMGQKVSSLLDKTMKKGTYQVTFNAADFASGIYFYELKINNTSQVKKMMLIK